MRKGFTLIELLAVIVILAIISLIAVPIVINIINDSKINSQKRSIDLYAKALEQAVVDFQLKNNKKVEGKLNTTDGKTLTRDDITLNVNYKGNVVCNRTIVNKDGSIYVGVCTVDGVKTDYEVGETTYGMIAEKKYKTEYGTEGVYARNFLNTSISGYNITSFNLYDKINIPSGYESLDCSYNQDESVICYWKEISSNKYEMNIASDGEMYTPVDSSYLFYNLATSQSNLTLDLSKLNTSKTINMSHMFYRLGNDNLTLNLGDNFNTKNVTNMSYMFAETFGYYNGTLDFLSKLDTSNVTDMSYMFKSSFKNYGKTFKLPDSFDTSNVTNMEGIFNYSFGVDYYSPSYSSLILSSNFNTKNVTNMKSMFSDSLIKSIDLGNNFDTSKVTNMNCMFYGMGYITELNLGNKFDTGNVIDMSSMFNGVNKVTNLNFGKYFDTSKVTNMQNMFYRMNSLEKLTLKDEFNTSNVTNMQEMFSETRSLTELKLGKNFYTNKVTNMNSMFRNTGYNSLTHLDLGENFINGTTTDYYNGSYFSNMFEGLGHNSLVELNLRNFNPMTSYYVDNIFKDCGTEGVLTKVIVSSESIKNKIKTDQRVNVPQFWKTDDWSIIQVQS